MYVWCRLARIKVASGSEAAERLLKEILGKADFDLEEYDKAMAAAFNDEYYEVRAASSERQVHTVLGCAHPKPDACSCSACATRTCQHHGTDRAAVWEGVVVLQEDDLDLEEQGMDDDDADELPVLDSLPEIEEVRLAG